MKKPQVNLKEEIKVVLKETKEVPQKNQTLNESKPRESVVLK